MDVNPLNRPLGLLCHRVAGVVGVPEGDQFVTGFADIGTVYDFAGEGAGGHWALRIKHGVFDGAIQAVGDVEGAVKTDFGLVGAQAFQFDTTS